MTCAASTTPPPPAVAAAPTVADHVLPPAKPPVTPAKRPAVQVVYPDHVAPFKPVATVVDNRIPSVLLAAYQHAAGRVPACHLRWQVLAGIGKVESNHARGGQVDPRGTVTEPIFGPSLTDGTRAVGPMQFLPSTWSTWGVDANGDGVADPQNVWDATASAADYLCADRRDLSLNGDLVNAILSYNHDGAYLADVFQWITTYSGGVAAIPAVAAPPPTAPVTTTSTPPPTTTTTTPPATTTTTPPNLVGAVVGGLLTDVGSLLGKK
ncbi:transglycosylase protein with SLT domain [Kutzneria buriramensis]|uniref:Transglycosylase protein with SLT domain n=1 Tax=Kutzneria buriramensis TaxID=1045776 RepID=A0A3E0HAC0_9PSEU|nr:transglycosylase protein with SLT domain [Kutzneria buriramensis]